MRPKWPVYALALAKTASLRSEDPYVKVGAVVLRYDNSVAGVGYNGAPPKVDIDWSDRDERRKRVLHAEVNALRYCRPGECGMLVSTLLPCTNCMQVIASYGINQVYFEHIYERDINAIKLAEEFGIYLWRIKPVHNMYIRVTSDNMYKHMGK